jgi:hypothetical protein
MEMEDERQLDHPMPIEMPDRFRYPPGLRICLCDDELKKLGLDTDIDEGDYVDIRAFATVMSVHKEAGNCRVELQIEKMMVESETNEDD